MIPKSLKVIRLGNDLQPLRGFNTVMSSPLWESSVDFITSLTGLNLQRLLKIRDLEPLRGFSTASSKSIVQLENACFMGFPLESLTAGNIMKAMEDV